MRNNGIETKNPPIAQFRVVDAPFKYLVVLQKFIIKLMGIEFPNILGHFLSFQSVESGLNDLGRALG